MGKRTRGAQAPAQPALAATGDAGSEQALVESKEQAEGSEKLEFSGESPVIDVTAEETGAADQEEAISSIEHGGEEAVSETSPVLLDKQDSQAAQETEITGDAGSEQDGVAENTEQSNEAESVKEVLPEGFRKVRVYANAASQTIHTTIGGVTLEPYRWSDPIVCTDSQLARFKTDAAAICEAYPGWSFDVEDVE